MKRGDRARSQSQSQDVCGRRGAGGARTRSIYTDDECLAWRRHAWGEKCPLMEKCCRPITLSRESAIGGTGPAAAATPPGGPGDNVDDEGAEVGHVLARQRKEGCGEETYLLLPSYRISRRAALLIPRAAAAAGSRRHVNNGARSERALASRCSLCRHGKGELGYRIGLLCARRIRSRRAGCGCRLSARKMARRDRRRLCERLALGSWNGGIAALLPPSSQPPLPSIFIRALYLSVLFVAIRSWRGEAGTSARKRSRSRELQLVLSQSMQAPAYGRDCDLV
jgi:hypothetical protein